MANYLQLNDHSRFEPEEAALARYFGEGNYIPFYKKQIIQNKLKITKDDFISGEIPTMFAAMRQLGISYKYNDYPECLQRYLHRKIWTSTMREVRQRLYDGLNGEHELDLGWFIKPKNKLKRFTGFVCNTIDDLWMAKGAGNNTELWCAEPVNFVTEFRCYFIKKSEWAKLDTHPLKDLIYFEEEVTDVYVNPYQCYAIGHYEKDYKEEDLYKVKTFIQDILLSHRDAMYEFHPEINWPFYEFPNAFALDLGILDNGEVAVVEMNDAFSIGKYDGIDDETYAKFLITRWNELKESSKQGEEK